MPTLEASDIFLSEADPESYFLEHIGDRQDDRGKYPYNPVALPDSQSHLFPVEIEQKQQLFDLCSEYMSQEEMKLVRTAAAMALWAHQDKYRASDEPYSIHFLQIATDLVKNRKQDAVTIASALLHDAIEDTKKDETLITTVFITKYLPRKYSTEVAEIVDGLTKIRGRHVRHILGDAQTESKLIRASLENARVAIIKTYDRLHNLKTLQFLKDQKQIEIIRETLQFYIPLAKIIGFYEEAREMEELCLRNLSQEHRTLADLIVEAREKYYSQIDIERIKGDLSFLTNIPAEYIRVRLPNPLDIYYEMGSEKIPTVDNLYLNVDIALHEYYSEDYAFEFRRDPASRLELGRREFDVHNQIFMAQTMDSLDEINQNRFKNDIIQETVDTLSFDAIRKADNIRLRIHIAPADNDQLRQVPLSYKYYERPTIEGDLQLSSKKLRDENPVGAYHYLAEKKLAFLKYRYGRIAEVLEITPKDQLSAQILRQIEGRSMAGYVSIVGIDNKEKEKPWYMRRGSTVMDYVKDFSAEGWWYIRSATVNGNRVPLDYVLQPEDRVHCFFSSRRNKKKVRPDLIHAFATDVEGEAAVRKDIEERIQAADEKEAEFLQNTVRRAGVAEIEKYMPTNALPLLADMNSILPILQRHFGSDMIEKDFLFLVGMGGVKDPGIIQEVAHRLADYNKQVGFFTVSFASDRKGLTSRVTDLLRKRGYNLIKVEAITSPWQGGPADILFYISPEVYAQDAKKIKRILEGDDVLQKLSIQSVSHRRLGDL